MKAAIVSLLVAGAGLLSACATTTKETAALSGSEMVTEFAAVSQELRNIDAAHFANPIRGRRSVVMRQVLGQIEPVWMRREELRALIAGRRESLTAEDIVTLIGEIDRDLAVYEGAGPAPSDVKAGTSRPFLKSQYTGGDYWASPDPNFYVSRQGLESTGMRHSEWRRVYRLKKEREALHKAMRTRAVAPREESLSAGLSSGSVGRG